MRPKHAGYLFVDHRNSPGIPDMPGMGEGQVFEADTQHCSHCNVPVILNPYRKRARFICPKCDWYCCDICAIAYKTNEVCKPFDWVAEEVQTGKVPYPILAKDVGGPTLILPHMTEEPVSEMGQPPICLRSK